VFSEFGPNLEHATPANVREFLDRMQLEVFSANATTPLVLDETAKTYEEIIKDFFARVLDLPRDEALLTLWSLALELSFAAIESQFSDRFTGLFKDIDGEID
jgi:hypothetical protein